MQRQRLTSLSKSCLYLSSKRCDLRFCREQGCLPEWPTQCLLELVLQQQMGNVHFYAYCRTLHLLHGSSTLQTNHFSGQFNLRFFISIHHCLQHFPIKEFNIMGWMGNSRSCCAVRLGCGMPFHQTRQSRNFHRCCLGWLCSFSAHLQCFHV